MNPTVGDLSGNTRKIVDWIKKAEKAKADLIVFPELAVSGYPVWDLANKEAFVTAGLQCLDQIAASTRNKKITAAVGFIDRGNGSLPGSDPKKFLGSDPKRSKSRNALAWIREGRIEKRQHKRLLPTYDVFLENIFFEPGEASEVVSWNGRKVGPTICEDLWDDPYTVKPIQDLSRKGADFIVNISASPYFKGVVSKRDEVICKHAARHSVPILYVNQVGAQDDLIFDGRSVFTDAKGSVIFRAPEFTEGLYFFDWDPAASYGPLPPSFVAGTPREMYSALVLGIQDYCRKNRLTKVIIGLSGGIDSALVAALAVDALGREAVLGISMPGPYSSRGSWEDSRELAKRLKIEFGIHPIRKQYSELLKIYEDYKKGEEKAAPPPGTTTVAMENLQARLRGMELMFLSNDEGRLLLSTGNKSELAMGYSTLYGDMCGGLAVIGDVYKTDVYRLAHYRNEIGEVIPKNILLKAPSAELRPNQKDEDSLPPYEILDEILFHYIEKNRSPEAIFQEMRKVGAGLVPARNRSGRPQGTPLQLIKEVIRKVDHNEYKRRQTPPILRVTEKAWFGRRMPITNRFEV